eukprot:4535839-Ditylum_brightwellii.AAC.1
MADKRCKKHATGISEVDMAPEDAEQSKVELQQVVLCIIVGIVGIKAMYDVGVIPVCACVWSWSWTGVREHTVGQ